MTNLTDAELDWIETRVAGMVKVESPVGALSPRLALSLLTELRLARAVVKAARQVTDQCSFTHFGGEAQDAYMEMEGAIEDYEGEGK
jgi:hypothetical protein